METPNHHIVEQLRETLWRDIKLQEEVRDLFKKILTRLSIIFITMSCTLLIAIGYVIFVISQPTSKAETVLKRAQDISYNLMIQKTFIDKDRQDVAIARAQFIEMLRIQDSTKKAKDSILNRRK